MVDRENDHQTLDGSSVTTQSRGLLKWFVLFTFVFLSMSNAMAWLIFAPVPTQTATYYGITGNCHFRFTFDDFTDLLIFLNRFGYRVIRDIHKSEPSGYIFNCFYDCRCTRWYLRNLHHRQNRIEMVNVGCSHLQYPRVGIHELHSLK